MKYWMLLWVVGIFGCSGNRYPDIPQEYHKLLDKAFARAGENVIELNKAIDSCDVRYKEGMAFLIAYMPEQDLKTLKAGFLLNNVDYAYMVKEQFPWTRTLPDSIFFNEVLPYACLNETRDEWRADFYGRFLQYVASCETIEEAIDSVNRNIRDELKVDYNTKREKPDQSPYESMRQGMASCSGLSILLVDAFRSVGIPARVAGTPNWHDNRGNHNWCEVWINGQWYFTEYYPNALNKAWFFADAGKADKADPQHAIYASSYKPADTYFPLVWDESIRYVNAENVTDRYVNLYKEYLTSVKGDGNHIPLKLMMFKTAQCTENSDDRVAANVDVFCGKEQVGGGRTSGPEQDMNDVLEFLLEKNKTYTFKYTTTMGKDSVVDVKVGEYPVEVRLYME